MIPHEADRALKSPPTTFDDEMALLLTAVADGLCLLQQSYPAPRPAHHDHLDLSSLCGIPVGDAQPSNEVPAATGVSADSDVHVVDASYAYLRQSRPDVLSHRPFWDVKQHDRSPHLRDSHSRLVTNHIRYLFREQGGLLFSTFNF